MILQYPVPDSTKVPNNYLELDCPKNTDNFATCSIDFFCENLRTSRQNYMIYKSASYRYECNTFSGQCCPWSSGDDIAKPPTVQPTMPPTPSPTHVPTDPTSAPSEAPTASSISPTKTPTDSPMPPTTGQPTKDPSLSPSKDPSASPTTQEPTTSPFAPCYGNCNE